MKLVTAAALSGATLMSACAAYPNSIQASYVSPNQYRSYSCEQLFDEAARLNDEVNRVSDVQRANANGDTAFVVGSLFLWPVIAGLATTHDHAQELAQDKGQLQAVRTELATRGCQ